jgi:hypothetical protein
LSSGKGAFVHLKKGYFMLLKNTSKRLITINTTPYISKAEALKLVKAGDTLYYSRENIAPDEQKEVPNEYCNTDFVQNLINIGNLLVLSDKDAAKADTELSIGDLVPESEDILGDLGTKKKMPKPYYEKPKLRKDSPETLRKYQTQAKLLQIKFEESWSVTELKRAIKAKQNK